MLVAEGHRFQRENRFARFVHRLDLVLETRRGYGRAEMTVGVYNNCYTCWNGRATNAGDKGVLMGSVSCRCGWFWSHLATPIVADVDIVIARGEITTGVEAQSDVDAAGCVLQERRMTNGRVIVAGCVETAA